MQTVVEGPPESRPPFRADSATLAREIKIYMERHEAVVGDLIKAGDHRAGAEASHKWMRVFDGLLCSMFCALRSSVADEKTWNTVSLAAVGSYGRGTLSFRSDLDVRILCEKPKQAEKIAEALLYPLWDAGLEIGHQVVTVSDMIDLAKKDLPTATTLLDWRHLAGERTNGEKLKRKAFDSVFSGSSVQKFLSEMRNQAEERVGRFGDSVYLLEPDVKNGQGGVRDLDIVTWTAQGRWHVKELSELVGLGVLEPAELEHLNAARVFLSRVRNVLHFNSRRRTERMGFEGQEMVARKMGYGKGGAACEDMMSDYYRHARVVSNSREALLRRAEPPPKRPRKAKEVAEGVAVSADRITILRPEQLAHSPVLALRAYWEAVHREMALDRETRDAISRVLMDEDVCQRLRESEEANRLFRRLLRMSRKVVFKRNSTLSEFHDVGILLAMIPEFKPVVGRVHHDIYHVYTVDVHSIAAVDRLRKFVRGEMADEHRIASRLAADVARPQVLYMAVLLHDVGKDLGGRSHSERGAQLSRPILERLGVQEHDIVEILHLIRKHLRMYHVASRRDIDDPGTIEMFRDELHGPEGLKELYLLTLCDVATTSPTALTSWKARMMEELYVMTRRSFDGLPQHTEERAQKLRAATLSLCAEGDQRDFLDHFVHRVPNRYMYANEPEMILEHAKLARESEQATIHMDILGMGESYAEVAVVMDDKPGVLSQITATFTAHKVSVIAAQLYSWVDRKGRKRVFDLFWVSAGRDPSSVKRLLPKLRKDLTSLIEGEIGAEELIAQRNTSGLTERPAPEVQTMVNFDNRSSEFFTVIEVIAEDSVGMLYRLSSTLRDEGMEVAIAKINTEGNRVADVFYVADTDGKKVLDEARVQELTEKLTAVVPQSKPG